MEIAQSKSNFRQNSKCLNNKLAVRHDSDSINLDILYPEFEWLCTTQLGFSSNKFMQPLKSLLITSYLLFNALGELKKFAPIALLWNILTINFTLCTKICSNCSCLKIVYCQFSTFAPPLKSVLKKSYQIMKPCFVINKFICVVSKAVILVWKEKNLSFQWLKSVLGLHLWHIYMRTWHYRYLRIHRKGHVTYLTKN